MTASNHPVRRLLPVFVPYSCPTFTKWSATSSKSSAGKGPDPTLVVYAFAIPTIRSRCRGPTPAPAQAPPAVGFEEVTKG